MTKLLHKPLKAFAIYALLILCISIPVYVIVVDTIWTTELDENNWLTLQYTKQKLQSKQFTHDEIEQINQIWGALQPGVSISKAKTNTAFQDSTYEAIRPNAYDTDDGEDRFRGLKSYVEINGEPYVLTIETNVEESDETFTAVATVTLVFFIILIIGFMLLNRSIAAKAWKPFYLILDALRSFELSKANRINLPSSNILEFKELNKSLEQMVNNNIDAYQQQKSFTENASHELQTPIALLKSKLDLLLQQSDLSPEVANILNGIEAPLLRLSRINKNLLLLAKVENHQYSEKQNIEVNTFIQSSLNLFEDYIDEKKLQLTMLSNDEMTVNANSFLVETLIRNLLSNAIRHTQTSGQILISTQANSIQIQNTGNESLDPKHLFERFSTASKEKVSSGLGLAIIKEIANKYHWQVDYHFDEGFHIFSVRF